MALVDTCRRLYDRLILYLRNANLEYHQRRYGGDYYRAGIDVLRADWDNLLLLDACRYDMFADVFDLDGELHRKRSRGSMTAQFLESNFGGRDATNVVYVTASPMWRRSVDEHRFEFHAVVDVWQGEGWDDEHSTVLPWTMVEYARKAHDEYPNKRLIVHFIQPHYPFVGSESDFDDKILDSSTGEDSIFWGDLRTGQLKLSPATVWEPYKQNLEILISPVETLLEELEGKTVVSSDHGNMVGDRSHPIPVRDWGHPRGLYTPELIEVPWLVYAAGTRKRTVREPPAPAESGNGRVRERLRDLGYTE